MKMKIVGAVGQVTGSCTWCIHEETGTQFLVDCGMVQGEHQYFAMRQKFDFDPHQIKFVLLTHAHLDHCGMLPVLRARGFCGKIYCTKSTADLTKLQLQDCYKHIDPATLRDILGAGYWRPFEKKADNSSRSPTNHDPDRIFNDLVDDLPFAPFTDERLGKGFSVSEDIFITPLSSSHMLGATAFQITWQKADGVIKGICFSGDVGSANNDEDCHLSLLRANQTADAKVDYFVCESTYGDKEVREEHYKNFNNRIGALSEVVSKPDLDTIVIPCFSMQRVQDVLVDLFFLFQKNRPDNDTNVYVDSPMACAFCAHYLEELQKTAISKKGKPYLIYLIKQFAERFGVDEKLEKEKRNEECQKLLEKIFSGSDWIDNVHVYHHKVPKKHQSEKKVIVTSSGMCQHGRVLEHLPRLTSEKTAFILTGFQCTPNGRNLKKLASGEKSPFTLTVSGKAKENKSETTSLSSSEIKGEIHDLSPYYSGHADRNGLLDFLFSIRSMGERTENKSDVTVFLNHGMNRARRALRDAILERNQEDRPTDWRIIKRVEIPHKNSPFFDLDKGDWDCE